ncbi:MAG: endolytic transglycosylase MltG [Bacillota bacterium]
MPVPKKSKKVRVSALLFLVCCVVLVYYNYLLLQSPSKLLGIETKKVVSVESGSTLNNIAQQLKEEQLIVDPLLFKVYIRLRGVAPELKAGYYRFDSGMTMIQIVDKLLAGEMATYKLTVPEGITIEQLALRLTERGISKDEFLAVARNKELDFLNLDLETRNEILYPLEGYLFPDTYQIPYGSSAQEVINIMLQGFKSRILSLEQQIKNSNYSVREIITIASLIQAEGKLDNELPIISSVIYNRLKNRMKLQIDATIQYILPERKTRLLYSNLKVDSSYNTYLNYGLPPGPINNPGLAAIKAALNPAETDYLYYVAVGDGEHKFSTSYREHLRIQNSLESQD